MSSVDDDDDVSDSSDRTRSMYTEYTGSSFETFPRCDCFGEVKAIVEGRLVRSIAASTERHEWPPIPEGLWLMRF